MIESLEEHWFRIYHISPASTAGQIRAFNFAFEFSCSNVVEVPKFRVPTTPPKTIPDKNYSIAFLQIAHFFDPKRLFPWSRWRRSCDVGFSTEGKSVATNAVVTAFFALLRVVESYDHPRFQLKNGFCFGYYRQNQHDCKFEFTT